MFCRQQVERIPEKYLNNEEKKKTEPYLVVDTASSLPGWMFGIIQPGTSPGYHHKTMRLINPTVLDISLLNVDDHRHDGREVSYPTDILELRNTLTGQWERHEPQHQSRCGNCLCTAHRVIGPGKSIKLPCFVNLDYAARRLHDPYFDLKMMGIRIEPRTPETPPPYRAYRVGRSYVVGQGVRPDMVAKWGSGCGEMIDQPNYYGIDGIDHNFSGCVRGIAWSPEMPFGAERARPSSISAQPQRGDTGPPAQSRVDVGVATGGPNHRPYVGGSAVAAHEATRAHLTQNSANQQNNQPTETSSSQNRKRPYVGGSAAAAHDACSPGSPNAKLSKSAI